MRTITINGLHVSKREFVSRWVNHTTELWAILDHTEIMALRDKVKEKAESRFETTWQLQNNVVPTP